MNKHQVEGRKDEAKGKVKEVVGKASGDKSKEIEGKLEKQGGKAQAAYGDLKRDTKESRK